MNATTGNFEGGVPDPALKAIRGRLNAAQFALMMVGIVLVALNLYIVISPEGVVQMEFEHVAGKRKDVAVGMDPAGVKKLSQLYALVGKLAVAAGVVVLVSAFNVAQYPVQTTVLSLVLSLGSFATYLLMHASQMLLIIPVMLVMMAALAFAVRVALICERERLAFVAASASTAPFP